jgi:hypothetical protein
MKTAAWAARVRPAKSTAWRYAVTVLWFIIWLISNLVGDNEVLSVDPVNWWAGTLILAVALDLGRQHAPDRGSKRKTTG